MQAGDRMRFIAVMQYLRLNFPERKIDDNLVRSYFNDLLKHNIHDVERAAKAYVKIGDKFPFVSGLCHFLST
jgi:hypothetical protein